MRTNAHPDSWNWRRKEEAGKICGHCRHFDWQPKAFPGPVTRGSCRRDGESTNFYSNCEHFQHPRLRRLRRLLKRLNPFRSG